MLYPHHLAGRDQAVYMTDLNGNASDDPSTLLALVDAPVLNVRLIAS